MESSLTRNEKIFMILGSATIICFLVVFSKLNNKPKDLSQYETAEAINYQMVRAEEGYSGYSLDGREIDETYQGIKGKNPAKTLAVKPVAKTPAKVAPVNKPIVAAVAVKSPTPVLAFTSQKTTERTVAKKEAKPDIQNSETTTPTNSMAEQDANETKKENPADKKEKPKKSFSQWRQELFAKPTKETMTEFINAFRNKELTNAEFQLIAQDLLDQNDPNIKGLGLMALRAQPSMTSLSQLVHSEEQLPVTLQAYVQQAYLAYVQPQNIQYLNQALRSQDKAVVLKSLILLSVNLPKIKSGDVAGLVDSRHLREPGAATPSVDIYRALLPSLVALSSVQVAEISPLAQQVATLIQSSQVAGL